MLSDGHAEGSGTTAGYLRVPVAAELLRTDVQRALSLLSEGKWLRVDRPAGRRPSAVIQLSQNRRAAVQVGLDVLALLAAAGYVAPGRTLPGGAWRYNLTPPGRWALAAGRPPAG